MKSGYSSAWRIFFLQRPTTAVPYGFREERRRRQKKKNPQQNKTEKSWLAEHKTQSGRRKAHRLLTTPPPVGLVPSTHTTQVTQVMWNVLARTPLLRFLPPCCSHAERHSALLQNCCFVFFFSPVSVTETTTKWMKCRVSQTSRLRLEFAEAGTHSRNLRKKIGGKLHKLLPPGLRIVFFFSFFL